MESILAKAKYGIEKGTLDLQIALGLCICLVSAYLCPYVQSLSACTAVIICSQDKVNTSWKTGLTRLIITAVGGIIGIFVVALDDIINNRWIFVVLVFFGALITILICKLVKVPYISARIGCITFILVATVATGTNRIAYAFLRMMGTFYGVLITLSIAWIFEMLKRKKGRSI